jgi:hypothetical protein
MGRYTIPELLFVPEVHIGTYHYIKKPKGKKYAERAILIGWRDG